MSSAMVGNGYQQNYNTYNGQPAPNQGQNVQDGYHEPHPSSRPPANEQQYYSSSPSQPQSVQTSPRRGVFYRLVSPEVGLPLGRYEERRKSLDDQRQRDYFAMMSQKEKMEQQKRQEEKMKKQAHAQKLHMQQPEQGLYNYDEVQRNLREERRKDYGEFVKFKEEQSKIKPAPTPPGGLDVGQNDLYRQHLKEDLVKEYQASLKKQQKEKLQLQLAKAQQEFSSTPLGPAVLPLPVKPLEIFDPEKARQQLQDDRKKDYNEILREKEQNPSPRRMPTPPHGLDIVSQSERTRQAREKQRQYGQELQKQTQEQMFKKIQNNISVIDRTGQLPEAPNQYNHVAPQQHAIPPPQQHASPSSRNIAPQHPPPQTASPPPPQHHKMLPHPPQHSQMLPPPTQHTQMYPPQQHPSQMLPPQSPRKPPQLHHTQMSNSYAEHHQATPAGSRSPPPRQRSHPTPQRTEHGYHPEYNGKQQSSIESRDGHRPPPHPRRHATPDRPDWARGPPPRQDGTPTGRSSFRRDDRQTPSYWNGGIPVRSPATTPSTRTPSTQHSNRTLTPKDSQENIPDIHLESYRKNPFEENRRGERNREYNEFLSQKEVKAQSKREQIDNLRRQPAVQPKFDKYASSDSHQQHRKQLESELRDQYQSFLSQLPPKPIVRHIPSGKSDVDVNFENQKAFPMGNDYAVKQKKLKEEWRKSYEAQKDKVGQTMISRDEDARSRREETFRESWERSMESPPIVPAGTYDLKREKIRQGLQADYQVYLASQQPANRSKEFWSSNDNPKIYPTSGEYRRRGEKMKEELREEFHVFMDKQEQPKERKKVFGEQGSVLFVSQYPDTKKHMNAERKRDMLEHLEKKKGEVPRRQGDPSMDEKNMFSDLGKSQDAHKKKIHENAKQDYRNYVDHAFPEGLNRGEPTFAARKAPPDSWYDAQPPTHRRSPPRDYRPDQENHQRHNHDAYAERLDQARANEALYRKHDHQMNDHGHRQPPPSQAQAPYALY